MKDLSEILLLDRTTKKNIVWASDDYFEFGIGFSPQDEIVNEWLKKDGEDIIQVRSKKDKVLKEKRTKKRAEVYTPSWVCNKQLNLIDDAWFGRNNVFNVPTNSGWTTVKEKIIFDNKSWMEYVSSRRLEIACGEAPYLVSRYNPIDCTPIPVANRIGILDRKMRVVNENTESEAEWFLWAKTAFESSYGFEYQGDSLYLARKNLLLSFEEYYKNKFNHNASEEQLLQIAKIITWNIWQMDAKSFTPPYHHKHCILRDWKKYNWHKKSICTYKDIAG